MHFSSNPQQAAEERVGLCEGENEDSLERSITHDVQVAVIIVRLLVAIVASSTEGFHDVADRSKGRVLSSASTPLFNQGTVKPPCTELTAS